MNSLLVSMQPDKQTQPSRTGVRGVSAFLAAMLLLVSRPALGQISEPPPPGYEGATVVEKTGAQVPLDLAFNDEEGRPVRLADYFKHDRPVLLVMAYMRCPQLCGLTLQGVLKAVKPMSLVPGKDFEIVTVDFDPREGHELAAAKKANYIKALEKPEAAAGWHFLTSSRPEAAKTLGDAIGFGFKLDPKGEQYLHQTAIYLCTADGRVSRALLGVQYDSDVVRVGLADASHGKISLGLWGVALSCGLIHFDPATGKYTWAAVALMRLTGITTVLVLATVIGTLIFRDRQRKPGPTHDVET